MTEAITGLDRPVPFGPWPQVRGGQIWTQTAYPCFSVLLGPIGSRHGIGEFGHEPVWVMLNNPIREQGNIGITRGGSLFWTRPQLQTYLHEHHYQYEGQCHDLINERVWEARERVAF